MFPITDSRNRVIAFGGRAMEKDVAAKYLNSPETPLFHKGHTLYNIAMARQAVHDGAKTGVQLVAVEGYVDVIAMVTAGFPASVAPLASTSGAVNFARRGVTAPTECGSAVLSINEKTRSACASPGLSFSLAGFIRRPQAELKSAHENCHNLTASRLELSNKR